MAFALTGARIFDGARLVEGAAVIVDGRTIKAFVPERDLPPGLEQQTVEGLIAPGFIDVQVNGGGGVLFNDQRSVEGIAAIGAAHRRFGTTGYLPTFITDDSGKMGEAVEAVRAGLKAGLPGLLGIHLEGPFLNPSRKGVHEARFMRDMADVDIALVSAPGIGRVMVTLAPERVPAATIARLAKAGVRVSAGHTEADVETIRVARGAGLTGFTHLFNAMPQLAGRAPGPVGAALDDPEAWCSIIVDLHHVDPVNLRVAIAARGFERTMLVTDAMPTVGTDLKSFELLGRTIMRRDGRLTTGEGTLAGSDLDMASAVRNAVAELGLSLEGALHMASRAPAEFLGLGGELGRIAPGFRASLVLLDEDLMVTQTWIDGASSPR